MATITPTVTATQIYTAGGGTTTNYSGYVGYSGTSTTLYSCRLAFTPSKNCAQMVLGISAKASGSGIYESRVNFRAAVYTSAKYPTSVNWAGDTPSVGSVQSFAMSTASSGRTTTGSVTITGSFIAGTTYYLLVWHYTSQQEFFYNAEWTLTGTVTNYSVTLISGDGYSYNKTSPQSVSAGSSFSFSVTISTGYMASDSFAVKAGSTTLSPSSSSGSTYNYSVAINATTTITVTGVMLGGIVRIANGSDWVDYQVYICDGTNWYQYLPYIADGSNWNLYS